MPNTNERRACANRQNAQKSTGPRTLEGKAKSSQNAIKHGLLAESVVVPNCAELESQEQFDELLQDLAGEYNPVGIVERLLVETIAASWWRLRRALRYEAAEIAGRVDNRKSWNIGHPIGCASLPTVQKTHLILRYETIIERRLNRATTRLEHLQAKRRNNRMAHHPELGRVLATEGGYDPTPISPYSKPATGTRVGATPCTSLPQEYPTRMVGSHKPTQSDDSRQEPNEPNPPQPYAPPVDTPVAPPFSAGFSRHSVSTDIRTRRPGPEGYPTFQPYKLPEEKTRP